MTPPAISVVMPVHNAGRWVEDAVRSVLQQSFRDFEFIVLDDGSTDDSLQRIKKAAGQDPRIVLRSRQHQGLVAALNEGVALASGEFIARMDADDISLPLRFERQLSYLKDHPECVALGTLVELIDEDGDSLGRPPDHALCHEELDAVHLRQRPGTGLVHPSVMMRRHVVHKLGGYADYICAEDRDLWLRLAEVGQIANLPAVHLRFRVHANSFTHSRTPAQRQTSANVVLAAYARRGLPVPPTTRRLVPPPAISEDAHQRGCAWRAVRAGQYRTARKYAFRRIAKKPCSTDSWRLLLRALGGKLGEKIVCASRPVRHRFERILAKAEHVDDRSVG